MADMPDNVDLNWIARRLTALQDDPRALRTDMDMLIRIVVRVDHTLDAVRETFARSCCSQGDLEAARRNDRRQGIGDNDLVNRVLSP